MKEYTFKFYYNDKVVSTRTFLGYTEEDAYRLADEVLKDNKRMDDWELIATKKHVAF